MAADAKKLVKDVSSTLLKAAIKDAFESQKEIAKAQSDKILSDLGSLDFEETTTPTSTDSNKPKLATKTSSPKISVLPKLPIVPPKAGLKKSQAGSSPPPSATPPTPGKKQPLPAPVQQPLPSPPSGPPPPSSLPPGPPSSNPPPPSSTPAPPPPSNPPPPTSLPPGPPPPSSNPPPPSSTPAPPPPSANPPPPAFSPPPPESTPTSPGPDIGDNTDDVVTASAGDFCKVIFEYEPQNTDELPLRKGDIIIVLEKPEGGWWKGQLGQDVGMFPVDGYVEPIGAEEVQQFIASQSRGKPRKTKEELQGEMKNLKDEHKALQELEAQLKAELSQMREDYKKLAKSVRSDLLEVSEKLPDAYYGLNPLESFHRDVRKSTIRVGEMMDSEKDASETVAILLEQITVFQPQFTQQCSSEKALKASSDKIEGLCRTLQSSLINQKANYDEEGMNMTFNLLHTLGNTIDSVLQGETDMDTIIAAAADRAEAPSSPRKTEPTPDDGEKDSKKDKKKHRKDKKRDKEKRKHNDDNKDENNDNKEETAEHTDEEPPSSPRSNPEVKSDEEDAGKDKKRHRKDKKRDKERGKDKESTTSGDVKSDDENAEGGGGDGDAKKDKEKRSKKSRHKDKEKDKEK